LGWTEQELATRRKSDPQKLTLAARLKKETTLSLKQIAPRLSLGTSKSASATLHRFMRPTAPGRPSPHLKARPAFKMKTEPIYGLTPLLCCMWAVLILRNDPVLRAAEIEISAAVVPTEFENQEAQYSSSFNTDNRRYQQVYDHSLFENSMPEGGFIEEIRFRLDAQQGGGIEVVIPDIGLSLSTSPSMTPFLPTEFAKNIGPDYTEVYPHGPLSLSSSFVPGGPNPFSLRIPFQKRFLYDPRQGNLLFDLFVYKRAPGPIHIDAAGNNLVGGLIFEPGYQFGSQSPGDAWIMQLVFTPAPEPSTGTIVFGAILLGALFRRLK
jgi:hypothetical protein